MRLFNNKNWLIQYFILSFALITPYSYAQTSELVSLTVTVEGLRNSNGVVQFSLYNKQGSIPDENYTQFLHQKIEKIDSSSAQTIFENLPMAEYAVNILHDENEDGKIEKGFILPIEGIGFSQYSTINVFNKPSFKGARIKIETDTKINIKIIYF